MEYLAYYVAAALFAGAVYCFGVEVGYRSCKREARQFWEAMQK